MTEIDTTREFIFMNLTTKIGAAALAALSMSAAAVSQDPVKSDAGSGPEKRVTASALVGTWTLTAADDVNPDGTRVPAYGPNPQGLLVFLADGRYSVQIFREHRTRFASNDKRQGTPEEYKDASLGMSSHFGQFTVDSNKHILTFTIDRASFPNWDGATQVRPFTLNANDLEWHVPSTPDGKTPVSAWHRIG